ncbi:MAG: hypothetical protein OEV80_18135, partial [candidate division Zixibacteria bacterium]|nr:hypothetical protein [candidate division Zixibacteria bacterium]
MTKGVMIHKVAPAVFAVALIPLLAATVLAQPDQNKHNFNPANGWILNFTDGMPLDGMHAPGEPIFPGAGGNDWNSDLSCWMASASNLMVFEGLPNLYDPPWLGGGVPPSPNVSSWGGVVPANVGAAMTFDDGGWQHWALASVPVMFQGPIFTGLEFVPRSWAINPIDWCQARFDEGHACGITLYWGDVKRGTPPGGYKKGDLDGYHAITIYEFNPAAGTVLITDSDDGGPPAAVWVPYFFGVVGGMGQWDIILPGIGVTHVNYAVALDRQRV